MLKCFFVLTLWGQVVYSEPYKDIDECVDRVLLTEIRLQTDRGKGVNQIVQGRTLKEGDAVPLCTISLVAPYVVPEVK